MGSLLLAAGDKGKRFVLPNCADDPPADGRLLGAGPDVEIHAREILYLRGKLNEILAKHTGQTVETIAMVTDRDNFPSAEDAVKYGIVDKVLTSREPG